MNRDTVRQYVNLLAAIATIVFNVLANALPLNGKYTGEISDGFDVYFVPAGYVFSIWGVIYLTWIAFAVYQLLPAQRTNPRLQRVGYLFTFSCLANMAWLYLWHYEQFALTVVVMLALLLLLIAIYLRLGIGRVRVTRAERWCVHVPFSIYLGWITVATIANITAVLAWLEWSGWGIGPAAWTLIMLAAAVCISSAASLTRGDSAFSLVLVWALAGIAVKHAGVPTVSLGAWVATALVALMAIVGTLKARRNTPAPQPTQ
jgi:hypothetical protein